MKNWDLLETHACSAYAVITDVASDCQVPVSSARDWQTCVAIGARPPAATVDRLLNRPVGINLDGDSYRLVQRVA